MILKFSCLVIGIYERHYYQYIEIIMIYNILRTSPADPLAIFQKINKFLIGLSFKTFGYIIH